MGRARANTAWAGRLLAVVSPAVATPILFHWYRISVYVLLGRPFTVSPNSVPETWVYIVMLGVLGIGVVLGWREELTVSSAVTSGGLIIFPWLTPTTEIGGPGYPALVFVGALLLTVTEWSLRVQGERDIGKLFEERAGSTRVSPGSPTSFSAHWWVDVALLASPTYLVTVGSA